MGAPPFQALHLIWDGSVGSADKMGDTLMAWVPLTLAGAGLVVTFSAGLWNIGIEGQIVVGAIASDLGGPYRPRGPPACLIPMMIVAARSGGCCGRCSPVS